MKKNEEMKRNILQIKKKKHFSLSASVSPRQHRQFSVCTRKMLPPLILSHTIPTLSPSLPHYPPPLPPNFVSYFSRRFEKLSLATGVRVGAGRGASEALPPLSSCPDLHHG